MRVRSVRRVSACVAIAVTAALAVGATGAGAQTSTTQAKQPDLSGVTIKYAPSAQFTMEGMDLGGFTKGMKYKVDQLRLLGGGPAMAALLGGAADVTGFGESALFQVQASAATPWTKENAPLHLVSVAKHTAGEGLPYDQVGVYVAKDSPIKTIKDLKGKKIAYSAGSGSELLLSAVLQKAKLTRDDVQASNIPATGVPALLDVGTVDAVVAFDSIMYKNLSNGAKLLAGSSDFDIRGDTAVIVRDEFFKDATKMAALRDFLGRQQRFWAWASNEKNKAKLLPIVQANRNEPDPKAAKFFLDRVVQQNIPITAEVLAAYQAEADKMASAGQIAKPVDVSIPVSKIFNDGFPGLGEPVAKPTKNYLPFVTATTVPAVTTTKAP